MFTKSGARQEGYSNTGIDSCKYMPAESNLDPPAERSILGSAARQALLFATGIYTARRSFSKFRSGSFLSQPHDRLSIQVPNAMQKGGVHGRISKDPLAD
jgi:hypothetical protein